MKTALSILLLTGMMSCALWAQTPPPQPAQPADPDQAIPAQPVVVPPSVMPVTNLAPTLSLRTNTPPGSEAIRLVVAADSSLKLVLSELSQAWADSQDSNPQVALQLTNAGTLRSKVAQGMTWDVFISSDLEDVQQLIALGLLSGDGQKSLARNSLVIYGRHPLIKDDDLEWYDLIGQEWKKVAVGNPELVGSGRKAKMALQKHDLLSDDFKKSYTYIASENLGLQLIQAQKADAVILYKTDLENQSYPGFDVFPIKTEDAPPTFYTAAIVKSSKNAEQAKAFIRFCSGEAARGIWQKHGFEPILATN